MISFDPYVYRAELKRVIDGDTVVLDIDLGLGIYVRDETVRLHGINAPEVRGKEKEAGIRTENRLRDLLEKSDGLLIRTIKDKEGKYGRVLVQLWARTYAGGYQNLNTLLVLEGLAEPQDY